MEHHKHKLYIGLVLGHAKLMSLLTDMVDPVVDNLQMCMCISQEKMSSLQSLHNLTNSCEFAVNSERMQYFHNGQNTTELFQMQCL